MATPSSGAPAAGSMEASSSIHIAQAQPSQVYTYPPQMYGYHPQQYQAAMAQMRMAAGFSPMPYDYHIGVQPVPEKDAPPPVNGAPTSGPAATRPQAPLVPGGPYMGMVAMPGVGMVPYPYPMGSLPPPMVAQAAPGNATGAAAANQEPALQPDAFEGLLGEEERKMLGKGHSGKGGTQQQAHLGEGVPATGGTNPAHSQGKSQGPQAGPYPMPPAGGGQMAPPFVFMGPQGMMYRPPGVFPGGGPSWPGFVGPAPAPPGLPAGVQFPPPGPSGAPPAGSQPGVGAPGQADEDEFGDFSEAAPGAAPKQPPGPKPSEPPAVRAPDRSAPLSLSFFGEDDAEPTPEPEPEPHMKQPVPAPAGVPRQQGFRTNTASLSTNTAVPPQQVWQASAPAAPGLAPTSGLSASRPPIGPSEPPSHAAVEEDDDDFGDFAEIRPARPAADSAPANGPACQDDEGPGPSLPSGSGQPGEGASGPGAGASRGCGTVDRELESEKHAAWHALQKEVVPGAVVMGMHGLLSVPSPQPPPAASGSMAPPGPSTTGQASNPDTKAGSVTGPGLVSGLGPGLPGSLDLAAATPPSQLAAPVLDPFGFLGGRAVPSAVAPGGGPTAAVEEPTEADDDWGEFTDARAAGASASAGLADQASAKPPTAPDADASLAASAPPAPAAPEPIPEPTPGLPLRGTGPLSLSYFGAEEEDQSDPVLEMGGGAIPPGRATRRGEKGAGGGTEGGEPGPAGLAELAEGGPVAMPAVQPKAGAMPGGGALPSLPGGPPAEVSRGAEEDGFGAFREPAPGGQGSGSASAGGGGAEGGSRDAPGEVLRPLGREEAAAVSKEGNDYFGDFLGPAQGLSGGGASEALAAPLEGLPAVSSASGLGRQGNDTWRRFGVASEGRPGTGVPPPGMPDDSAEELNAPPPLESKAEAEDLEDDFADFVSSRGLDSSLEGAGLRGGGIASISGFGGEEFPPSGAAVSGPHPSPSGSFGNVFAAPTPAHMDPFAAFPPAAPVDEEEVDFGDFAFADSSAVRSVPPEASGGTEAVSGQARGGEEGEGVAPGVEPGLAEPDADEPTVDEPAVGSHGDATAGQADKAAADGAQVTAPEDLTAGEAGSEGPAAGEPTTTEEEATRVGEGPPAGGLPSGGAVWTASSAAEAAEPPGPITGGCVGKKPIPLSLFGEEEREDEEDRPMPDLQLAASGSFGRSGSGRSHVGGADPSGSLMDLIASLYTQNAPPAGVQGSEGLKRRGSEPSLAGTKPHPGRPQSSGNLPALGGSEPTAGVLAPGTEPTGSDLAFLPGAAIGQPGAEVPTEGSGGTLLSPVVGVTSGPTAGPVGREWVETGSGPGSGEGEGRGGPSGPGPEFDSDAGRRPTARGSGGASETDFFDAPWVGARLGEGRVSVRLARTAMAALAPAEGVRFEDAAARVPAGAPTASAGGSAGTRQVAADGGGAGRRRAAGDEEGAGGSVPGGGPGGVEGGRAVEEDVERGSEGGREPEWANGTADLEGRLQVAVGELIEEGRVREAYACRAHLAASHSLAGLKARHVAALEEARLEAAAEIRADIQSAEAALGTAQQVERWLLRREQKQNPEPWVREGLQDQSEGTVFNEAGGVESGPRSAEPEVGTTSTQEGGTRGSAPGIEEGPPGGGATGPRGDDAGADVASPDGPDRAKGRNLTVDEMAELLGRRQKDPRAVAFEAQFGTPDLIALARTDLRAAVELHGQALYSFRILDSAPAEAQRQCVAAWGGLARECRVLLEQALALCERSSKAGLEMALLNSPKGRAYLAGIGQVYGVFVVLAAAAQLYATWLRAAGPVGTTCWEDIQLAAAAWEGAGLEASVRSALPRLADWLPWPEPEGALECAEVAAVQAAESLLEERGPALLCGLSRMPVLAFDSVPAVEWMGRHYLLPLANLWANRVSPRPPEDALSLPLR